MSDNLRLALLHVANAIIWGSAAAGWLVLVMQYAEVTCR